MLPPVIHHSVGVSAGRKRHNAFQSLVAPKRMWMMMFWLVVRWQAPCATIPVMRRRLHPPHSSNSRTSHASRQAETACAMWKKRWENRTLWISPSLANPLVCIYENCLWQLAIIRATEWMCNCSSAPRITSTTVRQFTLLCTLFLLSISSAKFFSIWNGMSLNWLQFTLRSKKLWALASNILHRHQIFPILSCVIDLILRTSRVSLTIQSQPNPNWLTYTENCCATFCQQLNIEHRQCVIN